MPKLGTTSFIGESGKEYTFQVYSLDHTFKSACVVYIFAKVDAANLIPLYVGQTTDLKARLQNHEKLPCVKKLGCNCICVLSVDEANLFHVETDLIHSLDCPCNLQP